jgi:hypothetical protein
MNDFPENLTVPAALCLIATRKIELSRKAFEAGDSEVVVPIQFGLDRAAWVIALDRQPELLAVIEHKTPDGKSAHGTVLGTIKGKFVEMDILDNGSTPCRPRPEDSPKSDYVFFGAERELLRALATKNIVAYTLGGDNVVREIDAALWPGREFRDEVREGRCDVVATAASGEPLRHIRLKRDDFLRRWPPEGGLKRGPKAGGANYEEEWRRMAAEMLDSGEVRPKHGAKITIAKLIHERGYRQYQVNTIADAISKTVDAWKVKHRAA